MPGIVTPGAGASFDTVPLPPGPEQDDVTVEITPAEGDTVELSGGEPPATYGPADFSDRFRFDIQNGMLDAKLRFHAVTSRSRGADVAAYSERQTVEFQVTQTAGTGSPSSALFALQFQDADPNASDATSQVEGRAEFNRMAAQNLGLLSQL